MWMCSIQVGQCCLVSQKKQRGRDLRQALWIERFNMHLGHSSSFHCLSLDCKIIRPAPPVVH